MRQYPDDMRSLARPLESPSDLDPLLDRIGAARFVLIGGASHGTSEYYRWRAEITRRLITERAFTYFGAPVPSVTFAVACCPSAVTYPTATGADLG